MTPASEPSSPERPRPQLPRSGPPDVPGSTVRAAQRGDPAAFAELVEHWDPHLRPFVHHTLGGTGSTDRVLAATYVRAYRALPRYRPDLAPGLWLHRIAYLATTDELRRLRRGPTRRRSAAGHVPQDPDAPDPLGDDHEAGPGGTGATTPSTAVEGAAGSAPAGVTPPGDAGGSGTGSADPTPPPPADDVTEDPPPVAVPGDPADLAEAPQGARTEGTPRAWRRLAPDQRALLTMVHLEGFAADAAARVFDVAPDVVQGRVDAARRLLARSGGDPAHPVPEAAVHDVPGLVRSLPVAPVGDAFWTDLGRRLLAERERPAAASLDPAARLARAHPAEPGFRPEGSRGSPGPAVSTLADQADRGRPRRGRGTVLQVLAGVVVAAGVVAAAVAIGMSGRIPDGSVTADALAATVVDGLTGSRYLEVEVTVEERAQDGAPVTASHLVTVSDDGSWSVRARGALDLTTFHRGLGLLRRGVVVPGPRDAPPGVLAVEETGFAAGPPDASPAPPSFLEDLRSVGTLLRTSDAGRAEATTLDGVEVWELTRTAPTGARGTSEDWRVVVGREDGRPLLVERRRGSRLVRRVRLTSWRPLSEPGADTFAMTFPPEAAPVRTDHGFSASDLASVPLLGRGQAVTPSWLPAGFELSTVALRVDPLPPPAEGAAGRPTAASERAIVSLGYQRGPERIVVTTSDVAAVDGAWSDPFPEQPGDGDARRRTLGDGRFNGTSVEITADARGAARLWGATDEVGFTVAGDLTAGDAYRVAASLR